jgi:alkylation response protein AidB-like acyl-CoA dehydrogenase
MQMGLELTMEQVERIRSESAAMDACRELSGYCYRTIVDNRWYKLFVPEELGGTMTPLTEAVRIIEQAAYADGNFGWAIAIGAGGGFFAAYMQPEFAREVFAPEEGLIAGSGKVSGIARKSGEGYVVSGSWKYCSGSLRATAFTANCLVEGTDEVMAVTMMPEQVEIIKDWESVGLRATESHSIRAENAFVPGNRTFLLTEPVHYEQYPIYRFPFVQFAEVCFAPVALGIGRHFLEEAGEIIRTRYATNSLITSEQRDFVEGLLESCGHVLLRHKDRFYGVLERTWEKFTSTGLLAGEELAGLSRVCKEAAKAAQSIASELYPHLGMEALMEHAAINRIWRDLHTACQHSALRAHFRYDPFSL